MLASEACCSVIESGATKSNLDSGEIKEGNYCQRVRISNRTHETFVTKPDF